MALAPTLLSWHERGVGKSTLLLRLLCPVARQTGSWGHRASVCRFTALGGEDRFPPCAILFILYGVFGLSACIDVAWVSVAG